VFAAGASSRSINAFVPTLAIDLPRHSSHYSPISMRKAIDKEVNVE
jgi:hypothetical protein